MPTLSRVEASARFNLKLEKDQHKNKHLDRACSVSLALRKKEQLCTRYPVTLMLEAMEHT